MKAKTLGPILIMLAAALWSLDAIIRSKISVELSSITIVFIEHIVGFLLLLPWLPKVRKEYKKLSGNDWGLLIILTMVASVMGTLLFTEALALSFGVYDFTTPIFLQKVQPLFAIGLAMIFLHEKIQPRFWIGVIGALIGSYLVSFGWEAVDLDFSGKEQVFLLSIGAAFCWGAGTVIGRNIVGKISFASTTFLRFLIAIPLAGLILMAQGTGAEITSITWQTLVLFIIIGLSTGAGALLIYYRGLEKTPAHIATICELTFPILTFLIAISILNPYGAPEEIRLDRFVGMVILLASILLVSFGKRKK